MSASVLWTAENVIRAVHGQCLHEQCWTANGVSIDSRTVSKGDLFIAIKGPNHDGHDHVAAAFAAGASAAIVARRPQQSAADAPLVFVEDTMVALQALGKAGRARAKGKIIAVTGSVGKTSTKEMLKMALGAVGKTYANPGSLNNHWGLPLALSNLPEDADYGIFEMGMNHAGELSELSAMARPDIALITTVELAHLEYFASAEEIADAKAEIFDGMSAEGIAVLNRDNQHYGRIAAAAKKKGIKKIVSFSKETRVEAFLIDCKIGADECLVNAAVTGKNARYTISASGMHMAMNSLAAVLTASQASGKVEECAAALSLYSPPKGRGVKKSLQLKNGGDLTVIDESYNANPASVRAAILVLANSHVANNGRRVLVLGDMRELGETSSSLHSGLAIDIMEAKIDRVFCCGEMMKHLFEALPSSYRGDWKDNSEKLAEIVAKDIRAGDVVSIKGSNSMKMSKVVEAIMGRTVSLEQKMAG